MADFYADSSVLVKRHIRERGTDEFLALADPTRGHTIMRAIEPVLRPVGECLMDDQILGAAREQRLILGDVIAARPLHGALLKWHRSERNIERDVVAANKVAGIRETPWVVCEQVIDLTFLIAEPGEQRQISILGKTRLAPALHGDAADEAELPPSALAERLEVVGGSEDRVHRRLR